MRKWFDNKEDQFKIKYRELNLEDYKEEIDRKRKMGLFWAILFLLMTIFIVVMVVIGHDIAFVVIPFPLWMAWKSWKIYRGRE